MERKLGPSPRSGGRRSRRLRNSERYFRDRALGSTWAVMEGQITIVRETTTHEKTGGAGASGALSANVARLFQPTARTGDLAETRELSRQPRPDKRPTRG